MGMDVCGKSGAYFRRNIWGWRPLAECVRHIAPDTSRKCKHWFSNDGDGLNARQSKALAVILETALGDGTIAAYIAKRNARLATLTDETCITCHGTGVRDDVVGREQGMPQQIIETAGHPRHGETGWCNGCDGRGRTRPLATWYRLTEDDIREFAAFLRESEGFQIC